MKYNTILSFTTILCSIANCCFGSLKSSHQEPKLKQNVILITISTLRSDHVGCFGYERDTTPNYDAFCKESILFRKAFATSGWMMPAHGSIFTSLYPSVHGATHIDNSLGNENYTLGERLKDYGYYCVGFSCSPRLDHEHGFAQGFDFYDDYSVSVTLESMAFGNDETSDINKQRTNALINDVAIRWLYNNTCKPFFMFIHYYDNHWDYLPPPPYNELYDPEYKGPIDGTEIAREPLYSNPPDRKDIRHIIALYDGEVRQTDDDLEEMLTVLKDKGLFDNSIIIILGDHGEQFYERGNTSHHGLYEELVHIPLAISVPDSRVKNEAIDALVSQIDILPTILDYLEIPIPQQCQGRSLKPLIEGKVESVNDYIFLEYTGGAVPDMFAVRSAYYKCFRDANGEFFAYDLIDDPGEQKKIYPNNFTEKMNKLQKHLNEFVLKQAYIE